MKCKKLTAVLGIFALVASCLSGCGSGEQKSNETTQTGESAQAGTADLSEHVEITIGGLALGDSSKDVWPTEVIKTIEDKFNCSVVIKAYDQESLNLD